MASRLVGAGFPAEDIVLSGPAAHKMNPVGRLRGDGSRAPLLLLTNLDVVGAPREEWTVDPFTFLERDGHYYGRGTTDDKAMCALWMETMLRLHEEEFRGARDVILTLTADEEGGLHNGVKWLL